MTILMILKLSSNTKITDFCKKRIARHWAMRFLLRNSKEIKMSRLKAVAYARYSSDKQQESSIVVQLAAIRRFCELHNIELIHEYVDEAQSGTNANRKDFQQMILDAVKREFRFVIVHRMDRWARNVDDARHYKKVLAKYGVKVISALEEFDETPEGEFFELMSMGMAELYSKKLARESKAGLLANAREGKALGGRPLVGYKVKNKRYVIEESEAEAVRVIFQLALKGYGYVQIRNYLCANGYKRADGRAYTAHFHDILRNRKYIGEYVFNRVLEKDPFGKRNNHKNKPESEIIRIPNGMPRIVDDTTFFKVQAILDERKQRRKTYNPKGRYPLSGLITCAKCGHAVCGSIEHNHSRNRSIATRMYGCNQKERKCKTKRINAEYLETYLYRLLTWVLLKQENSQQLIDLVRIEYVKTHEKLQLTYNELLQQIKQKESFIQENIIKETQEDKKSIRKYLMDETYQMRWEVSNLARQAQLVNEQISMYPQFKPKRILQVAKSYLKRLRGANCEELQDIYNEIIHLITIDNDNVCITLNLQNLLGAHEPIRLTIIEVRDYIALPRMHSKQALEFSHLTVML